MRKQKQKRVCSPLLCAGFLHTGHDAFVNMDCWMHPLDPKSSKTVGSSVVKPGCQNGPLQEMKSRKSTEALGTQSFKKRSAKYLTASFHMRVNKLKLHISQEFLDWTLLVIMVLPSRQDS